MLRAVNLGPHNRIKMDVLRKLYESLGFQDVRTYVQSGNVVFRAEARGLAQIATGIEEAIQREFGFRPAVLLRTVGELRKAIAQNPFSKRRGIEPSRLLITFLAKEPEPTACERIRAIKAEPEEIHLRGRELYIYYPNGMARPKVPWTTVEKILQVSGTGRNWNSVTKLLEIAEEIDRSK